MPEPIATYQTRVRGLWTVRHEIREGERAIGTLTVRRNRLGLTVEATWRPAQGEVLTLRRDPGLLRSQFSLWTEGREWLGSALRSSFFRREIGLSTPSKALRLLPPAGFGRGWILCAPKTGELARIAPRGLLGGSTIHVYRRVELELVVLAYFLGSLVYCESFWPGRELLDDLEGLPGTPSKA